jgi:hypothetical protein
MHVKSCGTAANLVIDSIAFAIAAGRSALSQASSSGADTPKMVVARSSLTRKVAVAPLGSVPTTSAAQAKRFFEPVAWCSGHIHSQVRRSLTTGLKHSMVEPNFCTRWLHMRCNAC